MQAEEAVHDLVERAVISDFYNFHKLSPFDFIVSLPSRRGAGSYRVIPPPPQNLSRVLAAQVRNE